MKRKTVAALIFLVGGGLAVGNSLVTAATDTQRSLFGLLAILFIGLYFWASADD